MSEDEIMGRFAIGLKNTKPEWSWARIAEELGASEDDVHRWLAAVEE